MLILFLCSMRANEQVADPIESISLLINTYNAQRLANAVLEVGFSGSERQAWEGRRTKEEEEGVATGYHTHRTKPRKYIFYISSDDRLTCKHDKKMYLYTA